MFLEKEDLKNNIYNYQIDQITQGDDTIVLQALQTAEQELKSYLQGNYKKEFLDGRLRYDIPAVFTARGTARNALLVSCGISIAKWYIIDLCNADILYEQAKERYDRTVSWLKQLAKGEVNLPDLPLVKPTQTDQQTGIQPFVFGSRKKFNHE